MIPEPDTVDQEAVARLAEQAAEEERRELQEERRRQEQIDLTERERQQEAERRQRKREQLEAIRQERAEAAKRAKLEQERLDQLAEAAARRQPEPSPDRTPAAQSGNNGTDSDLQARYMIALQQTANASWNRSLAPEGVPCKVHFRQLPGGEVVDVEFLSCPFDGSARESVERALRRGHMPYAGFEDVFDPDIYLTMCYPEEACPR
jgi:colicin import membrane protein